MKLYNIKSYLIVLAITLAICACSDNVYEDNVGDGLTEVKRLHLSVCGGVTVSPAKNVTRSTNLEFQNGTFVEGTEIGLFMMQGSVFQDYLDRSDTMNTSIDNSNFGTESFGNREVVRLIESSDSELAAMVAAAYADSCHYGYENIRAYIDPDGTIRRVDDGPDFIYPLHMSDRVAIVAYAPYDTAVTYDNLFDGMRVQAIALQNTDEGLCRSDILVGIPEFGNPFRGAEGESVGISFSHAMSSIQLHMTITNMPELCSDSIIVTMLDVALVDTLLLPTSARSLQQGEGAVFLNTAASTAEGDTLQYATRGDVVMARIAGLDSRKDKDGETKILSCNAIVLPQVFAEDMHPTFEITFKGRHNGLPDTTIVRSDVNDNVVLRSGKIKIYRTAIPTIIDDYNPNETLPGDGKDDVILGSPKKD